MLGTYLFWNSGWFKDTKGSDLKNMVASPAEYGRIEQVGWWASVLAYTNVDVGQVMGRPKKIYLKQIIL
jgi:hypothetical protein